MMRNHVIELLYARTKGITRIAAVVRTAVFGQKSASCPCFLPVCHMRSKLTHDPEDVADGPVEVVDFLSIHAEDGSNERQWQLPHKQLLGSQGCGVC